MNETTVNAHSLQHVRYLFQGLPVEYFVFQSVFREMMKYIILFVHYLNNSDLIHI